MPFEIPNLSDDDVRRLRELAKDEKTRKRLKDIFEALGMKFNASIDDILINGKPPEARGWNLDAQRSAQQAAYARYRSGTIAGEFTAKQPMPKYPNGESSYARWQRETNQAKFYVDAETFKHLYDSFTSAEDERQRTERQQARYTDHRGTYTSDRPPTDEPPLRVETHEEYDARMERERQARKTVDPIEAARKHGLKEKVYEPPHAWVMRATEVRNWTQAVGGYNRLCNIRRQAESAADLDKRGQDGYVNVQIDIMSPDLNARIQRYARKGWTLVVDHSLGQWLILSPRGGKHYLSFINPDTNKRAALTFDDTLQAWLFLDQLLARDRD